MDEWVPCFCDYEVHVSEHFKTFKIEMRNIALYTNVPIFKAVILNFLLSL